MVGLVFLPVSGQCLESFDEDGICRMYRVSDVHLAIVRSVDTPSKRKSRLRASGIQLLHSVAPPVVPPLHGVSSGKALQIPLPAARDQPLNRVHEFCEVLGISGRHVRAAVIHAI